MAEYASGLVSPEAVNELARIAACRYGSESDSPIRLVNYSENWTYLAPRNGADPLILRLYRPGNRGDAEIVAELSWMRALASDTDLLLPQVLHDDRGRLLVHVSDHRAPMPMQCAAFSYIAGVEPAESDLAHYIGQLGRLTGKLHRHARWWRRQPGFCRRAWNIETTLGSQPHWGSWWAGVDDEAERTQLRHLALTVTRRLQKFGTTGDRFGLVHADLRLANILVDRTGRLALIDFDDCGFSWFLYDLATTLTFNEAHPDRDALIAEWFNGYREAMPVSAEEEAEAETFLMLRRLLVSAWIGSHRETELAQQLKPGFAALTCTLAEQYLARMDSVGSRESIAGGTQSAKLPELHQRAGASTGTRPGSQPYASREETIAAFDAYVQPNRGRYLRDLGVDMILGPRFGARFQDAFSGRWYWNLHCNGGVFNLGHRNRRLLEVLREALEIIDIGNHHFVSGFRAKAAERLVRSTGGAHVGVAFTASGAEANDLAIRLARGVTGRRTIVTIDGAYHGHIGFSLASTKPEWQTIYGPLLPHFRRVAWNNLAALEAAIDDDTAALLMESIPATMGFALPAEGYLAAAQNLCRQRGALFLLDEVQTGLGRTGTVWFWQQEKVTPDVFVTGKGLSGGLFPIAAVILGQQAFAFLAEHPFGHSSTYGGSDLGCLLASELLAMVDNHGFLAHVRALAEQFADGLGNAPFGLRHRGLAGALLFDSPNGGYAAMRRLMEHGVWAIFSAFDPSTVQFAPVLTLTHEEADEVIGAIRAALA